jgi:hypothetical protein
MGYALSVVLTMLLLATQVSADDSELMNKLVKSSPWVNPQPGELRANRKVTFVVVFEIVKDYIQATTMPGKDAVHPKGGPLKNIIDNAVVKDGLMYWRNMTLRFEDGNLVSEEGRVILEPMDFDLRPQLQKRRPN